MGENNTPLERLWEDFCDEYSWVRDETFPLSDWYIRCPTSDHVTHHRVDGRPTSGHITNHRVDGVPHLTGVPIIGCPIFATVLSSLRWVIFAAAKIPLLSNSPMPFRSEAFPSSNWSVQK